LFIAKVAIELSNCRCWSDSTLISYAEGFGFKLSRW